MAAPAAVFATLAQPKADGRSSCATDARRERAFYRWGWAPLLAGCVVIAGGSLFGTEWLLGRWGALPGAERFRLLLMARSLVISGLLATWVGGYVLYARRRLEQIRDELHQEQARLAEQARRHQQAAGLTAMARALAHELRQPLNGLVLEARVLRRRASGAPLAPAELLNSVTEIEAEAARLQTLVLDYLRHSPEQHAEPRDGVEVEPIVRGVAEEFVRYLGGSGIKVVVDLPPTLPALRADERCLKQAVEGMISGLEGLKGVTTIRLAARAEDGHVRIAVTTDGSGFPDPTAVFRPFHDPALPGTGLPVAIVREVARAHGGEATATNLPHGAELALRLPLRAP